MTNLVTGNLQYSPDLREWVGPSIAESMSELKKKISDVSEFYIGARTGCMRGGPSCYDRLVQRIRTIPEPSTVSNCYQIAIDSLQAQAELEGPTQTAKAIIELAMMLQFDFSRQYVYLTPRTAAVECNAVDIVNDALRTVGQDYEHVVRSPNISAPLCYLRRLIVDSLSDRRSQVGLGECSEKLQSIFAEAAHAAQVRRVHESMNFFFDLWSIGNKRSDALRPIVREIVEEEGPFVAEQSALKKVIEAPNDHAEMVAVDEARKARDGSGSDPLPVEERWKSEELLGKEQVDAIKIVFDFGRTRAMR